MNFLETLLAEWFEYKGFFVRRNVRVGKRSGGGHDGELDVVAFHPEKKLLIHVECSMDADSWKERERRLHKKFEVGRKHIPVLFKGLNAPDVPLQIAVYGYGSDPKHRQFEDAKLFHVKDVLADIAVELFSKPVAREAVTESFSMLRTVQYLVDRKNGPGLKLDKSTSDGFWRF